MATVNIATNNTLQKTVATRANVLWFKKMPTVLKTSCDCKCILCDCLALTGRVQSLEAYTIQCFP